MERKKRGSRHRKNKKEPSEPVFGEDARGKKISSTKKKKEKTLSKRKAPPRLSKHEPVFGACCGRQTNSYTEVGSRSESKSCERL